MSKTYMIGDLHFGHKNICSFRKGFANEKAHSDFICEQWSALVTKNDTVYVLGDAAFTRPGLLRLHDLPGRKLLVRGNHDQFNTLEYLVVFDEVYGMLKYKDSWLTHAPIKYAELRGRTNVHGHSHNDTFGQGYYNVCCEFIGYTPINYQMLYTCKGEQGWD